MMIQTFNKNQTQIITGKGDIIKISEDQKGVMISLNGKMLEVEKWVFTH